ncbi:trans-sialidase [Trypanosoma cruzi Dm28c]|uniref:Trans-sialidase n=2 Tax=Trypanosoma cruzi TaxID=5693 RepID=V5CP73_TRYCR|nr:trans-sialidase [Trypanosoma cruzi Dm28c]PBJ70767.1 trans-sialidase [Trypanosoma cruzi cruzi]PWV01944.1 putative trans-sialidase, Group V [Trypanosoma cruzi]
MLSRVAAVKAPRTHNRRRVTGSSGRRREGGESEPQRPNMSRHLFYSAVLLLVLVMMCCGSGSAAQAPGQSTVSKFEWKNANDEGVTLESLGAPGLLKVGSDVFAVAEAQCKKIGESNSFTGIASQVLTIDNADTPVGVLNEMKDIQLLEEDGSEGSKKKVDVSRPTTVVKGNDIYMLVGKYSRTDATGEKSGANDAGLLLVKGKVSADESNKRIKWSDADAVPQASLGEQLQSWEELIGSGGSGFEMKGDKLVFPVEGTKKGETQNGEKAISLLIYTSDNAASWKLSKGMSDGGCGDPSVVERKDKLMMMTACDDGRRRVYESGDKGDSWTEALGTLSRVWGNKQGEEVKAVRSGFITATIDGDENNRNVMLVTLPVYAKETEKEGNGKGKLHLWLTDNTHIVDIGPVSDDDAAASSLLYKSGKDGDKEEEELIALYEKKNVDGESSHSLWSVLLTAQLQRVKEVLATWKEVDETVSKLCPSESAKGDASPEDARRDFKVTDGLVGLLSGNFSEDTWRDEYLGVNATVKGNEGGKRATKTSDGVKFTGAWAEWPVGSQGENQLYHFANYNFTLVATVSIDGVPKEEGSPIPLMGVKINGGKTVLLGLSYDKEKKWKLSCGGGTDTEDQSVTLATDTTHHVVILLRNGTQGSAYVDGQRVGGDVPCELKVTEDEKISHFYIGGDGNSARSEEGVSVTVTNVLLYNRPLDDNEITALNPNKAPTPKAKDTKMAVLDARLTPASGPVAQQTVSLPTPAGPLLVEQESSTMSSGVGGVGVSTSRETTVTNPLPGLESAQQLASVKSSDGSQSVNAASSSVGDKTVGRGAGDQTQNDETHQPSMDTPATADTNTPTAKGVGHDGTAVDQVMNASSREDEEVAGGTDGQENLHARDGEVNATALSSLGNVSQGNNSDAGTVRGSGLLSSLLLLLGLWVFVAL